MGKPLDIGRPPKREDGQCLYRLPEQFRENCEAAISAGFATSAEAFWYYEQRGFSPNLVVIRRILASIVRAAPDDKLEPRSEAKRLDDAMQAIFGRMAITGSNEKDDDEILQAMAWEVHILGASDDKFRGIVRRLLGERNVIAADLESVVRRIVRKFAKNREKAELGIFQHDSMPEVLEGLAINEIELLLHSVGVPTQDANPVNVQVDAPSYSDLDDEIP